MHRSYANRVLCGAATKPKGLLGQRFSAGPGALNSVRSDTQWSGSRRRRRGRDSLTDERMNAFGLHAFNTAVRGGNAASGARSPQRLANGVSHTSPRLERYDQPKG